MWPLTFENRSRDIQVPLDDCDGKIQFRYLLEHHKKEFLITVDIPSVFRLTSLRFRILANRKI